MYNYFEAILKNKFLVIFDANRDGKVNYEEFIERISDK